MPTSRWWIALVASSALVSSCSMWMCPGCGNQPHRSSSLVAFLYPDARQPPGPPAVPVLHPPLRVGLAFLPSATAGGDPLDAAQKDAVLARVKARFEGKPFIAEIVTIPDYYLSTARGFAGLEGLERLYSLDLVALVSYDQITRVEDNRLSLAYWTIVGAYVIPGTSHETTTLLDLAVVDPASRSLVLRAGGTDARRGDEALVDAQRRTREASRAGFD
ncbi:MAG: rhombotarget lipoprotein, partial [Proteobacteria bacterium]|nr:rhombotarget lipoprotein [Pseudomonadota bacterium]